MRHQQIQALLVCREELGAADVAVLNRHLAGCLDCRQLARLYDDNRAHLQLLRGPRPSREMREAVLNVGVEMGEATRIYGPIVLALLPFPITLVTGLLLTVYGFAGFFPMLALIFTMGGVVMWRDARLRDEPLFSRNSLAMLARGTLLDVAGIAIGSVVLLLVWRAAVGVAGLRMP